MLVQWISLVDLIREEKKMQFIDLQAQYRILSKEIDENIRSVLNSSSYDGKFCKKVRK